MSTHHNGVWSLQVWWPNTLATCTSIDAITQRIDCCGCLLNWKRFPQKWTKEKIRVHVWCNWGSLGRRVDRNPWDPEWTQVTGLEGRLKTCDCLKWQLFPARHCVLCVMGMCFLQAAILIIQCFLWTFMDENLWCLNSDQNSQNVPWSRSLIILALADNHQSHLNLALPRFLSSTSARGKLQ